MPWDTILPGLSSLIARLTGLREAERTGPPKLTDPKLKARIDYDVVACSSLGRDERIYTYDEDVVDPNERMVLKLRCQRQFTLQLTCTSYDDRPIMCAEHHLERVYTRLSWPSAQRALNALGVAFAGAHSFQNLSPGRKTAEMNRVWSVGAKDLMFVAQFDDTVPPNLDEDFPDSPIGTIDSTTVTSIYLYGADGDQLAEQIGPTTIPTPPPPPPDPPPDP